MITGIPLVDVVLITAALVTAVYTIYRKVVVPVCRAAKAAAEARTKLALILEHTQQLSPNGGAHLADDVKALREMLEHHCEWSVQWQGVIDHEFSQLWKALGITNQTVAEEVAHSHRGENG